LDGNSHPNRGFIDNLQQIFVGHAYHGVSRPSQAFLRCPHRFLNYDGVPLRGPFGADLLEETATTAFPADQASVGPTLQVAFAGWCLAGGVSAVTGPLRGIRRAAICSAVHVARLPRLSASSPICTGQVLHPMRALLNFVAQISPTIFQVYMAPWVGGGADVPLVNILKHIFRRIRPSAIAHKTFAFPSGCAVEHPTLLLSNSDPRLRDSLAVP